jgi:hypothetical protein
MKTQVILKGSKNIYKERSEIPMGHSVTVFAIIWTKLFLWGCRLWKIVSWMQWLFLIKVQQTDEQCFGDTRHETLWKQDKSTYCHWLNLSYQGWNGSSVSYRDLRIKKRNMKRLQKDEVHGQDKYGDMGLKCIKTSHWLARNVFLL